MDKETAQAIDERLETAQAALEQAITLLDPENVAGATVLRNIERRIHLERLALRKLHKLA